MDGLNKQMYPNLGLMQTSKSNRLQSIVKKFVYPLQRQMTFQVIHKIDVPQYWLFQHGG